MPNVKIYLESDLGCAEVIEFGADQIVLSVGSHWRADGVGRSAWHPLPLSLPRGTQNRYTIGRQPTCDMTLGHETVSRLHAILQRDADGWLLSDLGSLNGTRLNGWRVNSPSRVQAGDLVSFGATTFVLADGPR